MLSLCTPHCLTILPKESRHSCGGRSKETVDDDFGENGDGMTRATTKSSHLPHSMGLALLHLARLYIALAFGGVVDRGSVAFKI